jgi:hypothetical protein
VFGSVVWALVIILISHYCAKSHLAKKESMETVDDRRPAPTPGR